MIPGDDRRAFSPRFELCAERPFYVFQFTDRHGQVWHRTLDGMLHEGAFRPGG